MANAADLLGLNVVDKTLVIDSDLRTIKIPSSITNIGVESDDEVTCLHFRMPKVYGNVDLSQFNIYVNYKNAKGIGDVYSVLKTDISDEFIEFDWIVGRHAVMYKGAVKFIVCMKLSDGEEVLKEFNTTIASLPVLEGLEVGEEVIVEYTDLLEQWRNAIFGSADSVMADIEAKGEEVKNDIAEAVYDYVDENKEMLRGPKGETGSGLTIIDTYDTESALRSAVSNPNPGDAYAVGTSQPYDIYIYSETKGWVNHGPFQGPEGDAGSNPNLLYNWYFADPVNQRGQMEYSGVGYTIDGWKNCYPESAVAISENGITLSAMKWLVHKFENLDFVGKTLTASVLFADGELCSGTSVYDSGLVRFCTSNGDAVHVEMTDNDGSSKPEFRLVNYSKTAEKTIVAVKLEFGTKQTLARQDTSGNWVLNDPPPDKGMELLKCCMSTADPADDHANNKKTPAAVGARPNTWTPTAAEVGAFGHLENGTAFTGDLNDFVSFGSAMICSDVQNRPASTSVYGTVWNIFGNSYAGYITQFYMDAAIRVLYYRARIDGAWCEWKNFATTDYAVNKAGDTIKGTLSFASASEPNGWTSIFKNHNATYDAGTNISDYDKNSKNVTLKIQANANKIAFYDIDSVQYDILHTGNIFNHAVNKAGGEMTGELRISYESFPRVAVVAGRSLAALEGSWSKAAVQTYNEKDDSNNRRIINLYNSSGQLDIAKALELVEYKNGVSFSYDIFHAGNKPSGSYTGNGSGVERTIETGGIGNICIVYSSKGFAFVCSAGCFRYDYSAGMGNIPCLFSNGVLTIITEDSTMNENGVAYYYQVL